MGFQLSKMHRFIALVCLDFEFCLFVFEDVTQAIETFYDNFSQFYYLFQTKKPPETSIAQVFCRIIHTEI